MCVCIERWGGGGGGEESEGGGERKKKVRLGLIREKHRCFQKQSFLFI